MWAGHQQISIIGNEGHPWMNKRNAPPLSIFNTYDSLDREFCEKIHLKEPEVCTESKSPCMHDNYV
jgi:hypothetical protein